jgi:hypothetical protein
MKTVTKVLIINYHGEARLLAYPLRSRVAMDEVAYTLRINIPDRRPPSPGAIDLYLPEWSPPTFDVSATPLGWAEEERTLAEGTDDDTTAANR